MNQFEEIDSKFSIFVPFEVKNDTALGVRGLNKYFVN